MSYTLTYAPGGLASAADYLRSKGRGEDTHLLHVTGGELQSLQGLAKAHGGSLTINPETGLPEAGFLSKILPTVAIGAATYFGGPALGSALLPGASSALATGVGMGLISGLGTTLMTGDLSKGLTAGATSGLIGGLTAGTPADAAAKTAVKTAVPAAEAARAAEMANTAVNTSLNVPGTSMMTSPAIASGAQQVATQSPGLLDKATGWWKGLTPGQQVGVGLGGLAAAGTIGGMMQKQPTVSGITDKGTIRPYKYSTSVAQPASGQSVFARGPMYDAAGNPNLDTEERNYFNQSFAAQPTYKAAAGGLMQGDMYPQSQQVNTQFATPSQMPTSAEVVGADYDAATLPFSGEPVPQRMAGGGAAEATPEEARRSALEHKYTYDPATQQYTQVPAPPIPQPVMSGMGGKGGSMYTPNGIMPMRAVIGGNPLFNQAFGNQGMGGIGGMMGMLRGLEQQAAAPVPSYDYTYDPVQQRYTQMAEGGDVTSGFQGYGQDNQGAGKSPLEMLAMLKQINPADQQQQQSQVVKQAAGGLSTLGGYSDGGQLLKGPGDGVSDDIPAQIGAKQPARLADGEFVIPARIVSELGNGSTDAGAKRLYAMMDRIQAGRSKTTGKNKVAVDSKAEKHLPA